MRRSPRLVFAAAEGRSTVGIPLMRPPFLTVVPNPLGRILPLVRTDPGARHPRVSVERASGLGARSDLLLESRLQGRLSCGKVLIIEADIAHRSGELIGVLKEELEERCHFWPRQRSL